MPNWKKVIVSGSDAQLNSLLVSTATTSSTLQVNGDSDFNGKVEIYNSGSTVFSVDGSSGRLFSITDDLSDSLFSANTIAGLPVLEVFSDNTVKIGTFNDEAIIVNGNTAEITGSLFGTSSYSDNSDLLDGQEGTYYLNYNNFSNTPTIGNGTITISAGTDLTTGGSFTTNQTSGATITINHADTSTLSGLYGGSDNGVVIEDITVDGRGHVTAIGTRDLDGRFAASSHTHTASQITDFDTSVKTKLNTEGVISGSSQTNHDSTTGFVANEHIDHSSVSITAGTGLSGGGDLTTTRTLNIDLSELTDMTATMVGTDEFIVLDASADRRKAANEIGLSIFNNDSGFTTNTGTVTSVGGTGTVNGLTLTGTVTTTGNLTLGGTLSINNNDWSGADLSLANGGTGASLSDPGGDRILFWDDSTGAVTWLSAGTNITISGTTISSTDTNTTYSAGNGITLTGTTFTVAAGGGLTQDAGGLSHSDTSTQASVNNSNGTVIQDVTLDGYGHVTGLTSYNLDGRYYTETEADGKFLLNTTDTLVGDLTVTGKITAEEFHTEFVSASIIYQSGSTKFGDTQDDNHNFTGSVNITGSLSVNGSSVLTTADEGSGNGLDADTLDGNHASAFYLASNPSGYTSNTGTVTSVGITAGTGLSGGGTVTTSGTISLAVDLSELTDMTATMVGTDEFIVLDAGADRRKAANEIGLSIFNNDSGFTTNTGTVTSVGGTGTVNGLTLTGTVTTTGNLTLGGTLSINNGDWSGADLSLANGGTGASLSDPGGDRILFWDDSTGAVTWLSAGTNITISGTTISSTDTNTTYSAGNGITLTGTTFSVAAGGGLTQDAGGLSHSDTSTQASVNNSNGTVIQDVTLDGYGHVTGLTSYNLDGRYYTETEADGKFLLNTTDTLTGDLTVTAKLTAATIVETSTRELKENIQPLESQKEVIDSLQPVSYTWKEGGEKDFGLIAEDVAEIAPDLVSYDEEGKLKGIKYSKLSVLLLDVVKKQNSVIEELSERITKLETNGGK